MKTIIKAITSPFMLIFCLIDMATYPEDRKQGLIKTLKECWDCWI